MAWKRGPMPPDTWHWGGVVTVDRHLMYGAAFLFANFRGDYAEAFGGNCHHLQADEIAWYDNSLTEPPKED